MSYNHMEAENVLVGKKFSLLNLIIKIILTDIMELVTTVF